MIGALHRLGTDLLLVTMSISPMLNTVHHVATKAGGQLHMHVRCSAHATPKSLSIHFCDSGGGG